ncbi:hypothetical protein FQN57_005956 [Myotisia sp. PD_48]|nr:hypothetical protein FQN57_005956 [Myotisia sp. PD_48]
MPVASQSPGVSRPHVIKLPGQRRRRYAKKLLQLHPLNSPPPPTSSQCSSSIPLRIICISDTHNTQLDLPPGDLLIHAGDLTENGSFDEIQTQLDWLASQSHQHKLVVAGNHDVLLDEEFLARYPERRYNDTRILRDLDWGDVKYLCDASITLTLYPNPEHSPSMGGNATNQIPTSSDITISDGTRIVATEGRNLTVYGSPRTPQYGISAFQYPRHQNPWANKILPDTDIVVTHGPPRFYLDKRDFHNAGCAYLAQEIGRVRPSLVVFGHIHVGYGREEVVLNKMRREHDSVLNGWSGWGSLFLMAIYLLFARLHGLVCSREKMVKSERVTIFVNAAVVGTNNQLQNEPIVVDLN